MPSIASPVVAALSCVMAGDGALVLVDHPADASAPHREHPGIDHEQVPSLAPASA
jgi:hypothetical protein